MIDRKPDFFDRLIKVVLYLGTLTETTLQEIANRRYYTDRAPLGPIKEKFEGKPVNDSLMELAKSEFDQKKEGIDTLHARCSMLLTSIGILFGALSFVSGHLRHSWLAILPASMLIVSALLAWMVLDVRVMQYPTLDQSSIDATEEELKRQIVKDYHSSAFENFGVSYFLLDIYKVARIYLIAGLLTTFGIYSYGLIMNGSENENLVLRIKGDQRLIRLLMGPKGDPGEIGPQGIQGPVGPEGPIGRYTPQRK